MLKYRASCKISVLQLALVIIFCLCGKAITPVSGEEYASGRGIIPDALLRPQRGEAPRYPRDTVIGELGQGEVEERAYLFAKNLLSSLLIGKGEAASLTKLENVLSNDRLESLKLISPQKVRLDGGREEPDGSLSFLFRFIGREQWISGELYLKANEQEDAVDKWQLDDIILEDARDIGAVTKDGYRFEFSPYERFY